MTLKMTSKAIHQRLYRVRGKASQHPCIDCDAPARDWSWVHDTDGSDLDEHFVPRCCSCHRKYDYKGGSSNRPPGVLAKLSEAAKRQWSEDGSVVREAVVASNITRKNPSEETRAKMRASQRARREREKPWV